MYHQKTVVGIVDDDEDFRDALDLLLSSHKHPAEMFASAAQFMRNVEATRSDCLLVDINLGEMTGVEMIRQLQTLGYAFPVVFMTGGCDAVLEQQAQALKCSAFLRKPFMKGSCLKQFLKR